MRADNTAHLITAAQRRHEFTRAKAIRALRELDQTGGPVTFETVAHQARSPAPGSTPSPTSAPRSNSCEHGATARRAHRCLPGNALPNPPSCADWKPPTTAIGNSPKKTSGSADSLSKPSGNSGQSTHRTPPGHHENPCRPVTLR